MGLMRWLFGERQAARLSMNGLRAKEDDDPAAPGPYPTAEELEDRFSRSGLFRPEVVERYAVSAAQFLRDGLDGRQVVETIVRSGDRLPPAQVTSLGLPSSYVMGKDFLDGLVSRGDLVSAPGRIETMIHLAGSRAHQLFTLRSFQDEGIRHVRLKSPGGAHETALERRFNNRKITIAEAIDLVTSRGEEIRRSTFVSAVVPDAKRM